MTQTMNKQQVIKYLTDLMATVQMAHFKGRKLGVRVYESSGLSPAAINIDLYNFEGDGHDVVEGLHGVTPNHSAHGVEEKESGWVFNIGYDPDDEEPLYFLFLPDDDKEDYSILPDTLPTDLLQRIVTWLENVLGTEPTKDKDVTEKEIEMLRRAIDTHISRLYDDVEAYNRTSFTEAQKDCLEEIRKYRELRKKLKFIYQLCRKRQIGKI